MNFISKRPPQLEDILSIEAEHAQFSDLLQRHQEALIGRDYTSALADFEEFSQRLRRHIRLEEDVLIPSYANLKKYPRDGNPDFFLADHRKIENLIEEIIGMVRGLRAGTTGMDIVHLIEQEYRLKNLMEHHERREDRSLLPILKKHLSLSDAGKEGSI